MGKLYSTSQTLDKFKENFNETVILKKSLTLFMKKLELSNQQESHILKKNQLFIKSIASSNPKPIMFLNVSLELISNIFNNSKYLNNSDLMISVCLPPIFDNYVNDKEFYSNQISFLNNNRLNRKEDEDVKQILQNISRFKECELPTTITRTKTVVNNKFRKNSFFSSNKDSSSCDEINKNKYKNKQEITPLIKSLSKKYTRRKLKTKNNLINIDSNSLSSSIKKNKRSISIPKSSSLFRNLSTKRKKNSIEKLDYLSIEPIKEYSIPKISLRNNRLSKNSLGNINFEIARTQSGNKNKNNKQTNKSNSKALSSFNFQIFKKKFSEITQNVKIKKSLNNLHQRDSSKIKFSYDQAKFQQIIDKSRNSKMKSYFTTRSNNKKGNLNRPMDKDTCTIESKDQSRLKNCLENKLSPKTYLDNNQKTMKPIQKTISIKNIKKMNLVLKNKQSSELKMKKSNTERIGLDTKTFSQNIKQKYKTQKIEFKTNHENEELKKKFISIDIRKLIEEEEHENDDLNILDSNLNHEDLLINKRKTKDNEISSIKLNNENNSIQLPKKLEKKSNRISSQLDKNMHLSIKKKKVLSNDEYCLKKMIRNISNTYDKEIEEKVEESDEISLVNPEKIKFPKYKLDLTPLHSNLPFGEIVKQLKNSNQFLFRVTEEERNLTQRLQCFTSE